MVTAVQDVVRAGGSFVRVHALRALNAAVFVLLVALLYRQIDVSELRSAIGDADFTFVVVAFLFNLPVAALYVVRSHLVLLRLGHRVQRRVLIPAIILGNVAGSLTPASTGEILRATALRGHARIPATDGFALVLFERGVSVYLMVLCTGAAAAFVAFPPLIASAVTVACLPLLALPALGPLALRRLPRAGDETQASLVGRAFAHITQARGRLSWILEDRRLLVMWSIPTLIVLAISALQVWLLARGIAHTVDPAEASLAFFACQLAGIISLLPLGLGASDGSLAALLRRFGLSFDQGAAAAVLLRLIVTIPYGIVAILCYAYLQRLGRTNAGPDPSDAAAT